MSGILGLGAYSDDEDENSSSQTAAVSAVSSKAAGGIAGLVAYEDSDDEQQSHPETEAQQSKKSGEPVEAPPKSTTASINSNASESQPPSLITSSNAAQTAASIVTSQLNQLLPSLPSSMPLSAALAQRHAANLQRREAMKSNPRAQPLVASLLKIKSFHNPAILSQIADKLHIDSFGSNLPTELWKEQNLPEGKDEDSYEEIQKQAEAATAHRLATRTSIDFVPASSSQPATSSSMKNSMTAIVNADGSITRVRTFDAATSNASSTNSQVQSSTTRENASASDRARKSKWGESNADSEESRKRQKL